MPPDDAPLARRNHLIHRLSLPVLLAPSLLLAILTGSLLFLSSDSNVKSAFIASRCSSPLHSALPHLSRVPVLGIPLCYLTTFFAAALSSTHSITIMGTILSFIAALLTTTLVESARICNRPNPVARNPTILWLVLNLVTGAVALQAGLIPAAIMCSRWSREEGKKLSVGSSTKVDSAFNPRHGAKRYLDNVAEKYAIPISVIFGYVLPSLALLFYTSPVTIFIWFFFPLYVGIFRATILWANASSKIQIVHTESLPTALAMVYGPAILLSVGSHVWIIVHFFFLENDATPISRAALRFIEIDAVAMGAAMAYWLLIEGGWRIVVAFGISSFLVGPGAGLCIAWILREGVVEKESVCGEGNRKKQ